MRLSKSLQLIRLAEDKDIRTMAEEIGVGAATLCRIENGEACDIRSVAKVILYLIEQGPRKSRKTAEV